jgi:hypothetical protein
VVVAAVVVVATVVVVLVVVDAVSMGSVVIVCATFSSWPCLSCCVLRLVPITVLSYELYFLVVCCCFYCCFCC